MTIRVDVRGVPHTQGSMLAHALPNGKIATRYPAGVWPWRHQVQQAVAERIEGQEPLRGPVKVELGFDIPRPAQHYGTGRNAGQVKPGAPEYPTGTRGDLDKYVRAILDACTDAGLWLDDAQVVYLVAAKRYSSHPGVLIVVYELEA